MGHQRLLLLPLQPVLDTAGHGQRKQDGSCPRRGEVLLRRHDQGRERLLWETFDPRYEAIIASGGTKSPNLPSMCHPWSSGVAHWLTEHHVGIKPAKPGYEAVLLAPYISDLNRAVSGSVGTPRGKITVEAALDVRSGTVGVNATVPVRSRIALPALMNGCVLLGFDFGANRSWKTIEAPVPYDAVSEELGTMTSIHPDVASSLLYSNPIAPGRHSVLGLYGGCRTQETSASRIGTASDSPYPPFLPEEYPAQTSIDAKTRGDWIGKFGNEGHLLFGFDDGEDLVQLPPYVGVQSYFMSGGGGDTIRQGTFEANPKMRLHFFKTLGTTVEGHWEALGKRLREVEVL